MKTPHIYYRNSPNEQWKSVPIDDARRIAGSLYVDASGCTALTELKADAAEYVYASGCTALTELKADAAKTVDASGCTALTELKADAADRLALLENGHELITDLRPWRKEMAEAEEIFRAADPQIGDWCTWIHHEIQFERLSEPWQNRFKYIATEKPENERAWRFRLIRPTSQKTVMQAINSAGKAEVQ